MKIVISGRHERVTEGMKAYARQKVEKLRKYFDRATMARATLDTERDTHRVEIVFDVPRGVSLVGKAEAPDMYAACDLAEQKLAAQLRRFNQRLKEHRGRKPGGGQVRPPVEVESGTEGPEPAGEDALTYEDVIDRMRRGE